MNLVILIGNLGSDPEIRTTGSGKMVGEFSLATNDEGRDSPPEWHTVVVWEKQAELAQRFLAKGRKVAVQGRIKTRSWDDQNTGQKRYKTEIIAHRVEFIDKAQGQSQGQGAPQGGGYRGGPPQGQGGYQGGPPQGQGGYNPPPQNGGYQGGGYQQQPQGGGYNPQQQRQPQGGQQLPLQNQRPPQQQQQPPQGQQGGWGGRGGDQGF